MFENKLLYGNQHRSSFKMENVQRLVVRRSVEVYTKWDAPLEIKDEDIV